MKTIQNDHNSRGGKKIYQVLSSLFALPSKLLTNFHMRLRHHLYLKLRFQS